MFCFSGGGHDVFMVCFRVLVSIVVCMISCVCVYNLILFFVGLLFVRGVML